MKSDMNILYSHMPKSESLNHSFKPIKKKSLYLYIYIYDYLHQLTFCMNEPLLTCMLFCFSLLFRIMGES